ncbi:cation transporter [Coprinopsis cinerea AmutBmut pab1-1]|nr:cation transporter [Coprinopsis cinerea AmutBmut pab1-1]
MSPTPGDPRFPERPLLSAIQPPRHLDGPPPLPPQPTAFDIDDDDDGDIYRGEHPRASSDFASTLSSSSSGSSSSSSTRHGGPLGAITAIVEVAVSRWARRVRRGSSAGSTTSSSTSETSSSSSSSSNSRSSINTLARTKRRLKARSSQASLQTIQSEREIIAHISRLKALEESRQIPRQFGLYLPPTLEIPRQPSKSGVVWEGKDDEGKNRVLSTTSLSTVISHLEAVMRASRGRKPRGRSKGPHQLVGSSSGSRGAPNMDQQTSRRLKHDAKSRALGYSHPPGTKKKKGKRRAVSSFARVASGSSKDKPQASSLMPKAWFLDVASPTWEDLRALGKLLHIHPLTLEDILQQDPREKLELFPKLGYYFISFRAIESQAERTRMQKEARRHAEATGNDPDAVDIPIGEANVYLTVFNDGICCFHYRDISDHVARVRNRIVMLDEVVNMSSDWIAHGIIDSIVDSFFPFLTEIEAEVMAVDDLVYKDSDMTGEELIEDPKPPPPTEPPTPSTLKTELRPEPDPSPAMDEEKAVATAPSEKRLSKSSETSQESAKPHFSAPRPTLRMLLRRGRRYIAGLWPRLTRRTQEVRTRASPRVTTLRRMAKTRRLVTSLGRSLAGKSEVMTQIRKRLLQQGIEPSLGNGGTKSEELEVAIYMGDVHDHILTLLNSLNHIERMLSQSHPTYLSQLRLGVAKTKGGSDMAFLYLTVISIAVLCCQAVTGSLSMNLHVPTNRHEPGAPYNVFGIAISLVCVVLTSYLALVWYWWKRAERKRLGMLRKDTYYTLQPI